jgi:hypothetical protein
VLSVYEVRKLPSISETLSVVDEAPRSRAAREAAERALVRIVHHYGSRPEFVVLGGLLPELPWIQGRSLRTEFLRSRNPIDCCSRSGQCCLA